LRGREQTYIYLQNSVYYIVMKLTAIEIFWNKFTDYIFRRKTLTSILFLVVVFILKELAAISNGQEIAEFCQKLKSDNPDNLIYYAAIFIDLLFGRGSYIALGIALVIALLLMVLIYKKKSGIYWSKVEW